MRRPRKFTKIKQFNVNFCIFPSYNPSFFSFQTHVLAEPPLLTCGEAVPDLQPVVSAEGARRRRGVGLHVEAVELHHDLRHLGGEDHEGAVQVVGVLVGEARRLDDASGSRKVPGTFWTCEERDSERDADEFLKCRDVFGQSDGFSLRPRCELSGVTDRTSGSPTSCLWEFKTETKGFFRSNISKIENRS